MVIDVVEDCIRQSSHFGVVKVGEVERRVMVALQSQRSESRDSVEYGLGETIALTFATFCRGLGKSCLELPYLPRQRNGTKSRMMRKRAFSDVNGRRDET